MSEIAERYLAFWNSGDAELAEKTFTDQVEYHAPLAVLTGATQLVGFHAELAGRMPEAEMVARGLPDQTHDRIRVPWEIVTPGPESFATGTDVLVLDGDRIASVTMFLDRPPAGFGAEHG